MKIKLAILDDDAGYLYRIVSAFNIKYADRLEIYSFTDPSILMTEIDKKKIDVLVASDVFDIDLNGLPRRCGFAYFTEQPNVGMLNGHKAIFKFQKAELIYKQILDIYSEKVDGFSGGISGMSKTKINVFSSASGGTGASSMAAACALYFAGKGEKALYLDLEKLGSTKAFFSAEGPFDISDVIFALKSKKANLSLKLESCVKRDASGVYFYALPPIALDMLEMNYDEIIQLMSALQATGFYDRIVVDLDFSLDAGMMKVYKMAHSIVWTADGSEISNGKTVSAYQALSVLEQNEDMAIVRKVHLVYNKFSNKTGKVLEDIDVKSLGGAPRFEHVSTEQVINKLARLDIFEKLL